MFSYKKHVALPLISVSVVMAFSGISGWGWFLICGMLALIEVEFDAGRKGK